MEIKFDFTKDARFNRMQKVFILSLLFLFSITSSFAQFSINAGNNVNICEGDNHTLGGSPTASGIGSFAYLWSSNPNGFNSTVSNPIVNPTITTTYYLRVINGNDTLYDSTKVTIKVNPTALFSFSPDSVCSSSSITFTNSSTTGSTYLWTFGNGNTSTSGNPAPQQYISTNAGTGYENFTAQLSVTKNGCSSSFSKTIHIKEKPDASIMDSLNFPEFINCTSPGSGPNFNLHIINTSSTISTNTNYSLNWGDGSAVLSGASIPVGTSHVYVGQGYFTITLQVTGGNTCVVTKSYQVFNGSNPAISIGNPGSTNGCQPQTYTFPITYQDTMGNMNAPGTKYTIHLNDGTPDSIFYHPQLPQVPPASYTHTFSQSSCGVTGVFGTNNSFYVKITAENPCGSSIAAIEPIHISDKPSANFTASNYTPCQNTSVLITNTSYKGTTINPTNHVCDYTAKSNWVITPSTGWSLGSGTLGWANPTYNPTTWGSNTLNINFSTLGTYTVKLYIENSCGKDSIIKQICVSPIPSAGFSLSSSGGCVPQSINLTNSSNTIGSCDTATYTWAVSYGAPSTGNWNFSGASNLHSIDPSMLFSSFGIYTIDLTATNACGTSTSSQNLTIKSAAQVSVSSSANVCQGTAFTPTATVQNANGTSAYVWSFSGGSIVDSSLLNPGAIQCNTVGSFPLTLVVSNECGSTTVNNTVNVTALPTVSLNSIDSMCINALPITLSGGNPSGGIFSGTGVNSGIFDPSIAGAGSHTISYTYTAGTGCSNSATQTFNVNPKPIVSLGPLSPVCIDAPTFNLNNGSPAGGIYSGIGLSGTSFNPLTAGAGSHSILYSYTDINGCSNSDSTTIVVNLKPSVTLSSLPSTCLGIAKFALSGGSPLGGIYSGAGILADSFNTVIAGVGAHSIVYSFTDANGCSNSDTKSITVFPKPTVSLSNFDSVCINKAPFILIGGNPSGGNYSGNGIALGIFDPIIAGAGLTTIQYTFTDTNNCSNSDSNTIKVNPKPTVSLGNFSSICIDNLSFGLNGGTPTGGIYSGIGVNTGQFYPDSAGAGSHQITYAFTDSLGCSNIATKPLIVNNLPFVNAGNDTLFCNQPIDAQLNGIPSTGGIWTSNGIISASGSFTPTSIGNFYAVYSFTDTLTNCSDKDTVLIQVSAPQIAEAGNDTFVCLNAGNFMLTTGNPSGGIWLGSGISGTNVFQPSILGSSKLLYSYGSGSCNSVDSIFIIVKSFPQVNAGSDTTICKNSSAILNGNWTGGNGNSTIVWSPNISISSTIIQNPTVSPTNSQNYILTATDSLGCKNSDSVLVNVQNATPLSTNDVSVCKFDTVLISVSPSNLNTYQWSPSPSLSSINNSSTQAFPLSSTTFYVSATDGYGCVGSDSVTVTVNQLPVVNLGPDTFICSGENLLINTNVVGAAPFGYSWTNGLTGSNPTISPLINTNYKLEVTDVNLCKSTDSILVNVFPKPLSSFSKNILDSCPPALINFNNLSNPYNGELQSSMSFLWNFGNGFTSNQINPSQTFGNSGTSDSLFTIKLYSESIHSCKDSSMQTINVHPNPKAEFNPLSNIACAPFILDSIAINLVKYPNANHQYFWTIFNKTHAVISNFSGTNFPPYSMPNDGDTIFVRLITTNNFGCKADTIERMFTTRKNPTANFDRSALSGCHPLSVQLNNTSTPNPLSLTYTWQFGDGILSSTSSPTHTFTNTSHSIDSAYSIKLIVTSSDGCKDSISKQIIVLALPKANFGFSSACMGKTSNFQDSSIGGTQILSNWNWTFGDNTISSLQNPTHIYSNSGTFNAQLLVTNSNNCKDSIVKQIPIYALPIVNYSHDTLVCSTDSIPMNNLTTGANTYAWNFGNSTVSSNQNPKAVYSNSGYFTIKQIATSSYGCKDSASSSIHVLEKPIVNFTTSPHQGCAPLSVSFQNLSSGLNTSYSWNYGNGQNSSGYNPNTNLYNQGRNDTNYIITLSGTNQCGTRIKKDTILVHPKPKAVFEINKYYGCTPLTLHFSNNNSYGEPDTFKWNFGDGGQTFVTTQNTFNQAINHTFTTGSTPTTYTITYITINECGSDTMKKQITVFPLTVEAFFNADTLSGCPPLTVNFTNSSYGFLSVAWNFGDGGLSSQVNPSHTYVNSGNYTVRLIVSDSCSTDTTTMNIVVKPKPIVSFISSKDTVCANVPIQFTNTSTSALSTVSWNFGDSYTSSITNPTHAYSTPGTYTVSMTGYSLNYNCPGIVYKTIVVLSTPNSHITPSVSSGCVPLKVNFQGDNSYNYWNFGNGNTSVLTNPVQTFSNAGNYTVTLISSFANGCKDTDNILIYVHPKPIANFNISEDSSCLNPANILFTNNSTAANAYKWLFGNNTSSLNNDSIYVMFTGVGTYQNTLIAYNQFSCTDTVYKDFKILQSPEAMGDFTPKFGCAPLQVQFSNTSTHADSYYWNFGDGNYTIIQSPIHTYSNSGIYPIRLLATSINGCKDSINLPDSVKVLPTAIAGFTYQMLTTPIENSGKISFTNTSLFGNTYLWEFGDNMNDTVQNPIHRYMTFGDYDVFLYVNNEFGCSDSILIRISLKEFHGLFVSNAFSPDYGPNEVRKFHPKGIGLKEYKLLIYDTWGNLIWETDKLDNTEPAEGWDGNDKNGKPMPQDTYIWKISAVFLDGTVWEGKKYENGTTKRYGTITLIR